MTKKNTHHRKRKRRVDSKKSKREIFRYFRQKENPILSMVSIILYGCVLIRYKSKWVTHNYFELSIYLKKERKKRKENNDCIEKEKKGELQWRENPPHHKKKS